MTRHRLRASDDDLAHWTPWDGEPLVTSSEPWDTFQAHKPWVLAHDGVVYHFYGANGVDGFGVGLATSRPLGEGRLRRC